MIREATTRRRTAKKYYVGLDGRVPDVRRLGCRAVTRSVGRGILAAAMCIS